MAYYARDDCCNDPTTRERTLEVFKGKRELGRSDLDSHKVK